MPFRSAPSSRSGFPNYNEGSVLRSPRDGDNSGTQWLKNKVVNREAENISIVVRKLREDLNRLRLRKGGGLPTVQVPGCDPNTGDVVIYTFYGYKTAAT